MKFLLLLTLKIFKLYNRSIDVPRLCKTKTPLKLGLKKTFCKCESFRPSENVSFDATVLQTVLL